MYIRDKILAYARKGDLEAIKTLLDSDVRYLDMPSDGHNRTLLWEAVYKGRTDVARFLIRNGADVNIPGRHRSDIYVLLKPYVIAIQKKRDELRDLLEPKTSKDIFSLSFLGDVEAIKKLISEKPDIVNETQKEDMVWDVVPIHFALAGEQDETFDFLLKNGTNITAYSKLMYEIAISLNRRDFIEAITAFGGNPAELCVSTVIAADQNILNYFLRNGIDVNRKAWAGWPPIAYVSRGDKGEHPEKVELLLSLGAKIDATGPKGRTALHAACQAGFLRVATLLVSNGADINAKMTSGETPLKLALQKKHFQLSEYLIENGAK